MSTEFMNKICNRLQPDERSKTIRWSLDWRYQDAKQPTMRPSNGHIARTKREPDLAESS
jgi:hypothetical protein